VLRYNAGVFSLTRWRCIVNVDDDDNMRPSVIWRMSLCDQLQQQLSQTDMLFDVVICRRCLKERLCIALIIHA